MKGGGDIGFSYLSVPLHHYEPYVTEFRALKATQVAGAMIRGGITIFCPVAMSKDMVNMPIGWEFWGEHWRSFLEIADNLYVLCLPGWSKSSGVKEEIKLAKVLGLQIIYLNSNGMPCLDLDWEDLCDELLANPKNLVLLS